MGELTGQDREQAMLWSIDEMVAPDSMARVIDRFVEVTDLKKLGFKTEPAQTGRPRYPVKAMTKLLIYGYQNTLRSSRKMERDTRRNLEVIWLMNGLQPDYKTISEFRRENLRPLQKLLREFVKLCQGWDLIGGELIAIDGTKIKASNNKKQNFSRKKLEERIENIDRQIEEYLRSVEERDAAEDKAPKESAVDIDELLKRKERYEGYLREPDETGKNEISAVDPDARLMGNNRGGVDMAYNVQSAVDAKNHLVVDFDVSLQPADQGQLSPMIRKVKKRLKIKRFIAVADKGYYQGEDLWRAKKLKVKTIVSKQKAANPKDQPEMLHIEHFKYNAETDTYTCPMGHELKSRSKKTTKRKKYFNKGACEKCPYREQCTSASKGYRTVTRNEYADVLDEVDRYTTENMDTYKLRQQIVEHPFGTVKRTMDGYYFLLRTRRKVRTEAALLFLGYDLKRAYNVLGFQEIMARLDAIISSFSRTFGLFYSKLETCGESEHGRGLFGAVL